MTTDTVIQTRTTASKAIRLKCLDCCCGQLAEVRECAIKTCPLWRWRMGREQRDELYTRNAPEEKPAEIEGVFEEDEPSAETRP